METFIVVICIYNLLITSVALFYRSKAKEFESLFELSKGCTQDVVNLNANLKYKGLMYGMYGVETQKEWNKTIVKATPKLNKDGSIAKKRGRKPKA